MADADEEEVAAEPEECSRWAMMFLFGFAGVLVYCTGLFLMISNLPRLGVLVFFFGIFLFRFFLVMRTERYHLPPQGQRLTVDRLLLL